MELAIRSGMEPRLDGPVLADIRKRLAEAKQSLEWANDGLGSLRYEPRATAFMIDTAYQSVATWSDRVTAIEAELQAETAQEPAVMVDDEWEELDVPDVPGTITRRMVTMPKSPFEKDDIRADRLITLAVIEGCRVLRNRQSGRIFVSSGTRRNRLYQIDLQNGRCGCPGWKHGKPCKHFILAGWAASHAKPHAA